ncbi:MAG: tRNA (adenosine(37)-N6)-threonylcarbamoyltransferase complex ATPase subunit type 1 TsaE [Desulfobacteraceae bacterium]|nr:tRNA (adenosine(37)-N6)-threonylcarbamoyltransferase complex ATPase subunit type 1 TsaE [Desulfobacteraceae bacterium]
MIKKIISYTSEQTLDLGKQIGQTVSSPFAIALKGDLGAGKTTLVQGIAKGLGVDENYYITSPTFNIINEYPAKKVRLCHLDLYRLGSADELEYIGFDDLTGPDAIIVVEWPDFLEKIQFKFDLEIKFEFDSDYNRVISLFPSGHTGENMITNLVL